MTRLIKPPTPEQWAAVAAETLRENDIDAQVGPGPSSSARVTVRLHLGSRVAYVDVYHTLRVAAPGDNGTRERALEVLAGAGYLDGYRPGATGGMRAKMPADIEDAPAEPPSVPPLLAPARTIPATEPVDHHAAVLRFLKHELARFERHRAEGVKAGDPRAGKLATWASLTRTYIAQITRGDHLQIPEDETP